LRDFCAHVASVEVVMAAQKDGVAERALIGHPGDSYIAYVRDTFASLKTDQHRLLKLIGQSTSPFTLQPDPGPSPSGD
jgi:hypothetical protein